MRRLALSLPFAALLLGCPTEPPKPVKDPTMVEDEWASIPQSKEWLFATRDAKSDHKMECATALDVVKGEAECKGALCEHGQRVAKDWLARCKKYADSGAFDDVKGLGDRLAEKAGETPSECAEAAEKILRENACEDATCEETTQKWATKCGKSDGSPLVVGMLEKVVERRMEEPTAITLDTRTCDDLRGVLLESARCKDMFVCQDQAKFLEVYRHRCESEQDKPTIATAALTMAILAGAGAPTPPIKVRQGSPPVKPSDVPVALSDGSGAIVLVCDQRLASVDAYLEARRGCSDGKIGVARAFKTGAGLEVRYGAIDFPSDAAFFQRFPTIGAAGESDKRDDAAAHAFAAEVQRATKSSPEAALATLAGAMLANAAAFKRSAKLAAALASSDAALVPAFAELGKRKAVAAKGKLSAADLAGFVKRAETRAFADVAADGTIQIGSAARAATIEVGATLPQATAAYLAALKPALTLVKTKKPDKKATTNAKSAGLEAARTCGVAEKQMQDAKAELVSCVFGIQSCDAGKLDGLATSIDASRSKAEAAFHDLDLARTGAAFGAAPELAQAADAAGCREPWW